MKCTIIICWLQYLLSWQLYVMYTGEWPGTILQAGHKHVFLGRAWGMYVCSNWAGGMAWVGGGWGSHVAKPFLSVWGLSLPCNSNTITTIAANEHSNCFYSNIFLVVFANKLSLLSSCTTDTPTRACPLESGHQENPLSSKSNPRGPISPSLLPSISMSLTKIAAPLHLQLEWWVVSLLVVHAQPLSVVMSVCVIPGCVVGC